MPQSSCLCGNTEISFSGDPLAKFVCHCHDDRKITGSLFSTNIVMPEDSLQITKGTLKTYAKLAESGSQITSYFCGDCGSTLFRKSDGISGAVMVKVGCIDDVDMEGMKPDVELFVRERVGWLSTIVGAEQKEAMFIPGSK